MVLLRLNARHSLSLGVAVALALAPSIAVSVPAASAGQKGSVQHLTLKGFFTPGNVPTSGEIAPSIDQVPPHSPLNKALEHVPAAGVSNIAGNKINGSADTVAAWNGISHLDQRTAGTGIYKNTQFSLEPPDQGLCVGNGNVVETVNNAYQVYDTNGTAKTSVIALSQFFGLAPEVVRPAGPFVSWPGSPRPRVLQLGTGCSGLERRHIRGGNDSAASLR